MIQPCGPPLNAKTRRTIAAKIAMSHVHFADINPGTTHRHLGSYRVFSLAEDPSKLRDIASLYINFGFGQPVQAPVVETLPSEKEWKASDSDTQSAEISLYSTRARISRRNDFRKVYEQA